MKKDNELIAEFMGMSISSKKVGKAATLWYTGKVFYPEYTGDEKFWHTSASDKKYVERSLKAFTHKYHTSWNWLMPVVEKIVRMKEFQVGRNSNAIASALLCVDIKILYPEVVEFIKWYNKDSQ